MKEIVFLKIASFVIVASTILSVGARSGSVEEIYQEIDAHQHIYAGVTFPPPVVLLDTYDFKLYREKMEKRNCRGAVLELVGAFGRKYPELPHPISKGLAAWESLFGPRHYPEAHFCRAQTDFSDAYRALKDQGEQARPFPQLKKNEAPFRGSSDSVWSIQNRIGEFVRLALGEYPPAVLELAKLSESGDVIRLTPQFAYFALFRAKRRGLTDKDLNGLLNDARSKLSDQEITRLAPRIARGQWPRSEVIVQD